MIGAAAGLVGSMVDQIAMLRAHLRRRSLERHTIQRHFLQRRAISRHRLLQTRRSAHALARPPECGLAAADSGDMIKPPGRARLTFIS
jgi:hypothetical protein